MDTETKSPQTVVTNDQPVTSNQNELLDAFKELVIWWWESVGHCERKDCGVCKENAEHRKRFKAIIANAEKASASDVPQALVSDTEKIADIKRQRLELRKQQEEILDKYLGEGEGQWYHVGEWECEKSPIGLCIYHYLDDRALDHCIFCGNPNERK